MWVISLLAKSNKITTDNFILICDKMPLDMSQFFTLLIIIKNLPFF